MNCACGNEALHRCGWKLPKDFIIAAGELRVGDRIQYGIAYFRVEHIHWPPTGLGTVRIASVGVRPADPKHPATVRRLGTCDAPCCDFCAREVAEGRHICRAHWDAWQHPQAADQREKAHT